MIHMPVDTLTAYITAPIIFELNPSTANELPSYESIIIPDGMTLTIEPINPERYDMALISVIL